MSRGSILVVILAVLCGIGAAMGLVLAFALASRSLAKDLMGLLSQLYGDDHNTENPTGHSRGQEGDLSADGPDTVRRRSARRG